MTTAKLGMFPGMSFDDYRRIEAANWSSLKGYLVSPKHGRYNDLNPRADTPSTKLGHAVHAAVLEPERFDREYVTAPDVNARTNAGKAALEAFNKEHAGKITMDREDRDEAVAIAKSVREHPVASRIMSAKGSNEIGFVWDDAASGLRCKARVDRFCDFEGWPTLVDLKTTRDTPTYRGTSVAVTTFGYHGQAAFYLDGLATIAPAQRRWLFVMVETAAPYDVSVWELGPESLEQGRRDYRRALAIYTKAKQDQAWPGISDAIQQVDIQPYAMTEGGEL